MEVPRNMVLNAFKKTIRKYKYPKNKVFLSGSNCAFCDLFYGRACIGCPVNYDGSFAGCMDNPTVILIIEELANNSKPKDKYNGYPFKKRVEELENQLAIYLNKH